MNMHVGKPSTIATTDGIFVLDSHGFYVPYTPEETRWPIWLGIGLPVLAAWALIAGAAWVWLG